MNTEGEITDATVTEFQESGTGLIEEVGGWK